MKQAFLKLHLAIILAGFTGVFGKLITLNEGLLVWYRLFLSAILLAVLLLISKRLERISGAEFLKIGLAGFLLGLHWIFFYGSIKYSNISIGVVCFSMTGFFTAILAPILNRKKFSLAELLLSALTLLGIGLIFHFDTKYRTGIILGIISSLIVAFFTVFNERLSKLYSSETVTLYEMTGGFLGLTLIMPVYLLISPVSSILPSATDLGYLLLLASFCTVLLYLLVTQALRRISAFTVNLSFNLEPVYGILLAILIYQENKELSAPFYIGLALIILSVLFQMLRVIAQNRRPVLNNPVQRTANL
ncbi:DMT family transporter [Segetibacter sp. 3557_3]|uniref:DMT family transporter n=1 Tax=Segetibacter sp. 3557_3 TaxID=2547429 RepID=UPI001058B3EB|nr:DMT family transporter [Segetibacter sp. 3557_3]TDH27979.1 DMT family transporter [Segetibacter sp. 3557_3]